MQGRTITTQDVNGNTVEVYLPSRRETLSDTVMSVVSGISDLNELKELTFENGDLNLEERMALSDAVDALNAATRQAVALFVAMRNRDVAEAGR